MSKNNNIILIVLASIVIYAIMGIYADFGKLSSAVSTFKWQYGVLLLFFTTIGYFIRYIKWHIYLKAGKINIGKLDSLIIFISGLCMIITPGRIGEIWKSWLIKEISGDKVSKTIPIVIADRITDAISLMWLAFIGSIYYSQNIITLITIFVICLFIYVVIRSKRLSGYIISALEYKFRKYSDDAKTMHEMLVYVMRPKLFLSLTILNAIAWFFECLGLYYIIIGFGKSFNLLSAIFIFSFSSLIGGFSMIPGGIGIAEAGISGMLIYSGIDSTLAIAIAIILRLGSFWYGAILGICVYMIFRRKFEGVKNE
jgi:glycosyltransferase 2 family protein